MMVSELARLCMGGLSGPVVAGNAEGTTKGASAAQALLILGSIADAVTEVAAPAETLPPELERPRTA
jgi:hypothetical protein